MTSRWAAGGMAALAGGAAAAVVATTSPAAWAAARRASGSFAAERYDAFTRYLLLPQLLACMALRLYWNRLGSKAAAEPTAQLRARHLGATASGLALAAAAHGSGAAAALGAAIAFKLLAGGGSSGKRAGTAGLPPGWRATVGQMLAWATALELAKRSFLADGFILSSLAAQPWHTWALAMGLLQALFLQSWIPWTVARLAAAALGVRVPDEAPLHWLASSASVRAFWRSFHVSWYRWLQAYVYHPFGGGTWATLAVLFVSSCLHGARGPWLTWGAIQSCAILAERAAAGRAGAVPPLARTAAGQAAALSTLLVQLPLAPSLTSQLAWFLAVGAPFFLLNAARLRRQAAAVASEVRVGKLSVD